MTLYIFTLPIEVPEGTSLDEVKKRVSKALDEPPCDWGEWTVGPVKEFNP